MLFDKRLEILNTDIMNRCCAIQTLFTQSKKQSTISTTPATPSSSTLFPLEIIRKQYYKKTEINQLISKIQYQQNHYIYYNTDRRHHLMDGKFKMNIEIIIYNVCLK